MPRIPLRLIFAIITTLSSITLLAWGISSPGRLTLRPSLQSAQTQLSETRILNLDFPPIIRAGEGDRVRLDLEASDQTQAAAIPNIYETHHILAEARLDMAGVDVRPPDTVSEPLLPGQGATFFWSIHPVEAGRFTGTVWFYLRFIPKNGEPERRQTVSAQAIEIEATTLFGLRGELARWLGVVGAFVSSLLGIPFLVDAIKWLWKRRITTQAL